MTPAITAAKRAKVAHKIHQYSHDPDAESYGEEAAQKLAIDKTQVFKTLIVSDEKNELAVAVIPVSKQLDLKKMANALKVKKVSLADQQHVERSTGYILGGVSPLGQKKRLRTIIDCSANDHDSIFVSAGRRGLEIELGSEDLGCLTKAQFVSIGR